MNATGALTDNFQWLLPVPRKQSLCACNPSSSFPHQAFAELIILGDHMVLTHSL